jgi:hypothetical protein
MSCADVAAAPTASIALEAQHAVNPSTPGAEVPYFLAAQRASVVAIVTGLGESAAQQSVVPSGWSPISMVEHLIQAERLWFQRVVAGRVDPLAPLSADVDNPEQDASQATGGSEAAVRLSRLDTVLAGYREQCALSDDALAATSLTARPSGQVPADMTHEIHNVAGVVLHMIEETARHAGHLDIARELIDGRTGLGPR